MIRTKKASLLVFLCLMLTFGFSQLSASTTYSIGPCSVPLANPSYPFLYNCPADNCTYTSTIFTCTDDNGTEIPILYRNPTCDNYYCVNL